MTISKMSPPKHGKPRRVRNPQQLERKRLLDRLLQKSRREQHALHIEALHDENRNMRLEITRLRSSGNSGESPLQNTTIPIDTFQMQNRPPCCYEPREHQVAFFEKTVYNTLIQSHLHPLPPLPRNPSLEDLLFLRQPQDPVSAILYPVLRRPSLQDIVIRTAYYLMCWRILRYRLSPSPETYDDVPPCLRTSEAEDSTPHPVYADFIIFPRLREAFVLNQIDVKKDKQFEVDFISHLSLNWPASDGLIIINDAQDTVLNPVFESHVSTFENWSMDKEFAQKYPLLAPLINIRN